MLVFCRFLKPDHPAGTGSGDLDAAYPGSIRGVLPFSLDCVRSMLNQPARPEQPLGGNLLVLCPTLPLYGDPLVYQRFFERT